MFDLAKHTLFVTLAGSQAHGTAREGSDLDLRGVCVAPLEVRVSLFASFEQHESALEGELWQRVLPRIEAHATAANGLSVKTESVLFDIAKFLGMCAAANPNALEILFADERDWLYAAPEWQPIHQARRLFLTQKVSHTFTGYALAQLKRIKTHRSWLLNPPLRKPTRADFGLPDSGILTRDDQNRLEQSIAEKVRSYGLDTLDLPKQTRLALQDRLDAFQAGVLGVTDEELEFRVRAVATSALNIPADVVATLNAEKKYLAAMKHRESYETWKAQRNGARAALEQQHGYDTKHAMHLVRLMRMGLEALETGELHVRRSDAAELNSIRDGALSYDELIAFAESLQEKIKLAASQPRLPAGIDPKQVDALLLETIRARSA